MEPIRSWFRAVLGAWSVTKTSYSQHKEDVLALGDIQGVEITEGVYVDVGGNHPTRISNTYLLYRRGGRGIVIEPNRAFLRLYARFRPRDVFLCMGCADCYALMPFHHHPVSHVLSSLGDGHDKVSTKREFVPVMPLDAIMPIIGDRQVSLLSVDVEGFDLDVLKSGSKVLQRTKRVIVEFASGEDAICETLESCGFMLTHRTTYNMIFARKGPANHAVREEQILEVI